MSIPLTAAYTITVIERLQNTAGHPAVKLTKDTGGNDNVKFI